MANKTIGIVGGNSGIGLALVRRLLANNHTVVAASRNSDALTSLGVEVQPFDATTATSKSIVWPSRLDGLVYCPGSITLKPFNRLTHEDFTKDLQVNLLGAVAALQSALPALKKGENPSVVLFSTVAVHQGMPMHASIAAAKGAVEGLTKSLAAEWSPTIRVNAIAPSLTNTPLANAMLNSEAKLNAAAKRHPLNTVGDADDLAAIAELLLNPSSKFMTGQILRPDGGMSSVRLFS